MNDDNRFLPWFHFTYPSHLDPNPSLEVLAPERAHGGRKVKCRQRVPVLAADFSLRALYAALDAQRHARGLSWSDATREINRQSARASVHQLSSTTVRGIGTRSVAEGDGVLQMLLWLHRTPESFIPDSRASEDVGAPLPDVPLHRILRFDTRKLHAALEAQRADRHLTWAHVAAEIGVSVSSLTHLSQGGRTGFPQVMRVVRWLARPAADFVRASDR